MANRGYVRVTNRRKDMAPDSQPEDGEAVIDVDRTHPVLGNRHVLKNKLDRLERARVIEAYRTDMEADFRRKGLMFAAVRAIADRVIAGEKICLQCNCRPLPCHAAVIEEKVNWLVGVAGKPG